MDNILGRELPQQRAGLSIHAVHVAIAAAEVHLAVRDSGRGREQVPGVGNGLSSGRVAVQILRLKLPFVLDRIHPFGLPGLDVEGRERARRGHEVEGVADDGRRGSDRHPRLEVPRILYKYMLEIQKKREVQWREK